MSGPVVVGVDGSPCALEAVAVAAHEARVRGCGLKVVHAFIWPLMHVPLGPSPLGPAEGGLRNMADAVVTEAVERARATAPEVELTHAVVTGEPLTVLEAQSATAVLVVVGSRGLGGFSGLLLGSTAVHLAAHGRCPVLVVRGRPRARGRILVGVDGSAAGDAAVEFAFEEAALRDLGIVALHACRGDLTADGEELLATAVAGGRERFPTVPVTHKVVREGAREALIEASGDAALLVMGCRGRGGFSGLLLGSVSQALLHHAHCPVAVIRGGEESASRS